MVLFLVSKFCDSNVGVFAKLRAMSSFVCQGLWLCIGCVCGRQHLVIASGVRVIASGVRVIVSVIESI